MNSIQFIAFNVQNISLLIKPKSENNQTKYGVCMSLMVSMYSLNPIYAAAAAAKKMQPTAFSRTVHILMPSCCIIS